MEEVAPIVASSGSAEGPGACDVVGGGITDPPTDDLDWASFDSRASAWATGFTSVESLLAAARSERAATGEALSELTGRHAAQDAGVKEMSAQLSNLAAEVASREDARRQVDEERADLGRRHGDLQGRVTDALDELSASQEENARLRSQLSASMPTAQVQELLQAAEQRVAQVNELMRTTERKVGDATKRESGLRKSLVEREQEVVDLRTQFGTIVEGLEKRLGRERAAREAAEARGRQCQAEKEEAEGQAVRATRLAEKMEKRIISLEAETVELREMMRAATDGAGLLQTIAKIREVEVHPEDRKRISHRRKSGGGLGAAAARGGGADARDGRDDDDPAAADGVMGLGAGAGTAFPGAGAASKGGRSPVGFDAVAKRVEGVARRVDKITGGATTATTTTGSQQATGRRGRAAGTGGKVTRSTRDSGGPRRPRPRPPT